MAVGVKIKADIEEQHDFPVTVVQSSYGQFGIPNVSGTDSSVTTAYAADTSPSFVWAWVSAGQPITPPGSWTTVFNDFVNGVYTVLAYRELPNGITLADNVTFNFAASTAYNIIYHRWENTSGIDVQLLTDVTSADAVFPSISPTQPGDMAFYALIYPVGVEATGSMNSPYEGESVWNGVESGSSPAPLNACRFRSYWRYYVDELPTAPVTATANNLPAGRRVMWQVLLKGDATSLTDGSSSSTTTLLVPFTEDMSILTYHGILYSNLGDFVRQPTRARVFNHPKFGRASFSPEANVGGSGQVEFNEYSGSIAAKIGSSEIVGYGRPPASQPDWTGVTIYHIDSQGIYPLGATQQAWVGSTAPNGESLSEAIITLPLSGSKVAVLGKVDINYPYTPFPGGGTGGLGAAYFTWSGGDITSSGFARLTSDFDVFQGASVLSAAVIDSDHVLVAWFSPINLVLRFGVVSYAGTTPVLVQSVDVGSMAAGDYSFVLGGGNFSSGTRDGGWLRRLPDGNFLSVLFVDRISGQNVWNMYCVRMDGVTITSVTPDPMNNAAKAGWETRFGVPVVLDNGNVLALVGDPISGGGTTIYMVASLDENHQTQDLLSSSLPNVLPMSGGPQSFRSHDLNGRVVQLASVSTSTGLVRAIEYQLTGLGLEEQSASGWITGSIGWGLS